MLVLAEMSMVSWLIIDVFIFAILWRLLRFVLYGRIPWHLLAKGRRPAAIEHVEAARVRVIPAESDPEVIEVIEGRETLPQSPTKRLNLMATVQRGEVARSSQARLLSSPSQSGDERHNGVRG